MCVAKVHKYNHIGTQSNHAFSLPLPCTKRCKCHTLISPGSRVAFEHQARRTQSKIHQAGCKHAKLLVRRLSHTNLKSILPHQLLNISIEACGFAALCRLSLPPGCRKVALEYVGMIPKNLCRKPRKAVPVQLPGASVTHATRFHGSTAFDGPWCCMTWLSRHIQVLQLLRKPINCNVIGLLQ